jgi:hypothetical protein
LAFHSGRETDHSPPPSAEVKNGWSCTSIPPIRLRGAQGTGDKGQLDLLLSPTHQDCPHIQPVSATPPYHTQLIQWNAIYSLIRPLKSMARLSLGTALREPEVYTDK